MIDKAKQQAASRKAGAHGTGRPPRRVFVRGLEMLASIGVFEVEKRYEQRVIVSLELQVTDDYDGASDRLDDVLDYGKVAATAQRVAQARHFNLLETMAERIAEGILADSRVETVRVRIEKPDILPGCRSVGIEIERSRREPECRP
jgi:dihydroneopterin aldolase